MVAFSNGRAPLTLLKSIAPNTLLLSAVAQAYWNMQAVARIDTGEHIGPAGPYGSGYRDMAMQTIFYRASKGDQRARAIAHLDPHLNVTVAYPGASKHGFADRIDMLFNGHSPTNGDLELAARYGFIREFGRDDANHFRHDRVTAISGVRGYDKIRLTARYLNERHIGVTTNAVHTGKRDHEFIWLVQHYGHMTHIYPAKAREDGVTGPYTERAFDAIWAKLRAA